MTDRSTRAARAASAPQMGVGVALAIVTYGLAEATLGLTLDEVTVTAWGALCEGVWQMVRRMMEKE